MPPNTGRERAWDIEIDGVPYRVIRDKNGVPAWSVEQAPAVAGETTRIAQEPRQWKTWHLGFGYSERLTDGVYHYGTACDARFPQQLILGPLISEVAHTGTGATDLAGNALSFFEQSSKLYVLATRYAQEIDTTDNHFHVAQDLWVTEVETVTIGGTPTSGHYHLTYNALTTGEIAYDATAATVQTALRLLAGLGSVTVATTAGTTPNFTHAVTFTGVAGNLTPMTMDITALAGGTPTGTIATTTQGANANGVSATNFDGNTVVWLGPTEACWVFTGSAWTRATTNTIKGSYGAVAWYETFYALAKTSVTSSTPVVSWISEGLTIDSTSWGAEYTVGDKTSTVTGITAFDQTFYVAKTDGLYQTDKSARTPKIIPTYIVNATNGVGVNVDAMGQVWMPTVEGYWRYDSRQGTVYDCSPGRGLPNTSPVYGQVTAHAQHKGWRYICVYNATTATSYLMCGRDRESDEPGVGPMLWHGALASISGQVTAMHITSLTTPPQVYLACGDHVYWFILPAVGDNPQLSSAYAYSASGIFYLPKDDWGVPGTRWYFLGLDIDVQGATTTKYIEVYAKTATTGWVRLPTKGAAAAETDFRIDASGAYSITVPVQDYWLFNTLEIRLDFTNGGATTSSPRVRAMTLHATRRPAVRDLIHTTIYCSDRVNSRFGIPTRKSGAVLVTHLKDRQITSPKVLKDWWTGSVRERNVLILPVQETVVKQEGDDAAEQALNVPIVDITPIDYVIPAYGTWGRLGAYTWTQLGAYTWTQLTVL